MAVGQESAVVSNPIQRRARKGRSFQIYNSVPRGFDRKDGSSNGPIVQQLPRWGHLETFTVIKWIPAYLTTLRNHSLIPDAVGKTTVMGICYPLPQDTLPDLPPAFKANGVPESAIRTNLKHWFSSAGREKSGSLDVVEGKGLAESAPFPPSRADFSNAGSLSFESSLYA